ncbi:DMT family transporter [Thalassomonas sp. M1454]|uniref:DMT family transporter n=1 Tax=Thalassomonas sp. M1454 TaxID=2594477 RepID=UPI00117C622D|nr:DMT family transporter [Thalassomonas sp. M1454]TRX55089.1 EamA family transporter [Thalassomonas sp. M1454]
MTQPFILLHCAVLLFALCALFGKWLDLPALYIVLGRSFFAAAAIFLFCQFTQQSLKLNTRSKYMPLLISGILLALHWWSFFHCIRNSSVTLGLLTFACFPVFVTLFEPVYFKQKLQIKTLVSSLICLLGLIIIFVDGSIEYSITSLVSGLLSAISFAALTLFNKKFIENTPALQISFYQNLVAAFILAPGLLYYQLTPEFNELLLLILLGVVFTALAHTLLVYSLRYLSAGSASIALNLEPVYGVIAAMLIFSEPVTINIVTGAAIILLTNMWVMRTAKSA